MRLSHLCTPLRHRPVHDHAQLRLALRQQRLLLLQRLHGGLATSLFFSPQRSGYQFLLNQLKLRTLGSHLRLECQDVLLFLVLPVMEVERANVVRLERGDDGFQMGLGIKEAERACLVLLHGLRLD